MKLKFVLVPLTVLGFIVGSYADCNKDEVLKLLDKGYSKSEVDGLCGKSDKKKSKWIIPNKSMCVANGGKMRNGVCGAEWSTAKKLCHNIGGELASRADLEKVMKSCGAKLGVNQEFMDENKNNSSYQSCIRNKGFISTISYWTSTKNTDSNAVFVISSYDAVTGFCPFPLTGHLSVVCVK